MKTIFITIANRQQARNILRTDVLKTLKADFGVRTIFFTPEFKVGEYRKEFSGDNVIFEGVSVLPRFMSHSDAFFGRLSLFYVKSPTAKFLRKQWLLLEKKQPLRYIASMAMLFLFGNLKFLRVSARFLDYHLVRDKRLDKYFKKYKPNLVFTSNIIVPLDRSFLRHAKKRGVRTVGMINSWDNITLSKYPFRILPNHLVVHNAIIKDEAVKYLDIPKEKIFISGLPHFDFYVTGKRSTREEFCTNLGISSDKRIILFASIGSSLNPTERQVLSLLDDAIVKEKLPKDMVIIFRQHPTEKTLVGDTNKSSNIIIDDSKTILTKENSYSEILTKDMEHLADSIFHSDVMINTASTMSIDASVFDKPVINIAFDGWEEKQFHESVSRFYKPSHAHYQPIVKSGGVRITYSIDDLIEVINLYLNDPTLDKKGRRRIVEEQCYKLDGQSGKRIGIFLLSLIKN